MGGTSEVGKGVVSGTVSWGVSTTTGVFVGVGIRVGVAAGIGSLTGVGRTGCTGCAGTFMTEISLTTEVGVIYVPQSDGGVPHALKSKEMMRKKKRLRFKI
jgi:hypothetical protein